VIKDIMLDAAAPPPNRKILQVFVAGGCVAG
jgi:hypothetical protein